MDNKQEHEGSTFVRHEPCLNCGSRNNLGVFSDGHKFCFGCRHYERGTDPQSESDAGNSTWRPFDRDGAASEGQGFIVGTVQAIPNRRLDEDTCRLFGYGVGTTKDGEVCHVANFRSVDGTVRAQSIRRAGKRFSWIGDHSQVGLFGEWLYPSGRRITITEGVIDALSVSQVFGNKYPVVSLPDGAGSAVKTIKSRYDYLVDNFEEIILMFDQDEPGRDAATKVAELLPPGKVKIATLPLKDANECLVAGRGGDIIKAFWDAKPYRPDGIVSLRDIKHELFKPVTYGSPWPWKELTNLTYGRFPGHLYGFGAGVGVGKTDLFTECIAYDVAELNEKVGIIYLEQPTEETVQRIAGKIKSKLFHLPDGGWTEEEYRTAIDELDATDNIWLYNHFGAKDWKTISSKIRYFAKVLGIKKIYLDHITALIAHEADERRALDSIMADMAGLAIELGIIIHFISHLTTPEGKPHEEGGRVMEKHFTGSRAIARWAHYMIGLERNKQAEDMSERSIMTVRVLKDRKSGRATGCTFPLYYNQQTGRLTEGFF